MNLRRDKFIEHYSRSGNATQSALAAGYRDPENSGRRLLKEPEVHDAIRAKVESLGVETRDILERLAMHAFSDPAALLRCMKEETVVQSGPDGEPVRIETGRKVLDLDRVEELGLGPLIKRVTPTKYGDAVELVDAQNALQLLGKHLGMFVDRLQVEEGIDLDALSDDQLRAIVEGRQPDVGLVG